MSGRLVSDPRRDASATIRGYVYQAYQSVRAWMHLGPHDELFLEAAEDFDVHSSGEATATQVKDRAARSVTLRSPDVVEAINNFWNHATKNSPRPVRLRFLTTAERGQEVGTLLGQAGLDYWEAAAAGATPVEPLRTLLLTLPLAASVRRLVETGTDEALRGDLLSRIEWDTGNRPLEGLKAALEDDLVSHGDRFGVPPSESARALGNLLANVAELLSSTGERRLTYAAFCRAFESATMAMIPRGRAEALQAAIASPFVAEPSPPLVIGPVFEPPLPLVKGAIPRKKVVDELAAILRANGALLLWGSTGVGKTSVASLVTARFDEEFSWAGFRDQTPSLIAQRLSAAAAQIRQRGTTPRIVLDDLDLAASTRFEHELLSLAFHIRRLGGLIITTGYTQCSAELLDKLWRPASCVRQVPYLDEADIAEFLAANGAPGGQYATAQAKLTLATTAGHPQLVHARVRRLTSEKWPEVTAKALFDDSEISRVRTQARRRLMEELPTQHTRALAYRLSVAIGPFTRGHALAVAQVAPPVSMPGECLELLVGPWIERLGGDAFRVSPLLCTAGNEMLPPSEVIATNEALALFPFQNTSIDPGAVGPALLHAMLARSKTALAQIVRLLLATPFESVPGLAESLFVFPAMALKNGQLLFDGDPALEVMLRVVQFKTASSLQQSDVVISIIDRALEALPLVPSPLDTNIASLAYGEFLANIEVPIPPSRSVPMLAAFMRITEKDAQVAALVRNFEKNRDGMSSSAPPLSAFQILFQFEAARMDGVETLDSLLVELSRLPESEKSHLLPMCEDATIAHLLVNEAWRRDVEKKCLDADRAVAVFERVHAYASQWGVRSLARAAAVAVAVLHDEYRHDPRTALASLERASVEFGRADGRILVGRAKIFYGEDKWAPAITSFEEGLQDATLDAVDRVFAMRMLGAAAAKIGEWAKAAAVFLEAAAVARKHHARMLGMSAGLKADAAYALWKQRDMKAALQLFAEVLGDLDQVPVDGDLKNRHVHATVRHTVVWIWGSKPGSRPPSDMAEPLPGMCSSQDPYPDMAKFEIRDLDVIWNLLAAIDEHSGSSSVYGTPRGSDRDRRGIHFVGGRCSPRAVDV